MKVQNLKLIKFLKCIQIKYFNKHLNFTSFEKGQQSFGPTVLMAPKAALRNPRPRETSLSVTPCPVW